VQAAHVADLIEQFWRLTAGRASPIVSPVNDTLNVLITDIGQNCPKTPPILHYQGKSSC
jgi:hypothetical protein